MKIPKGLYTSGYGAEHLYPGPDEFESLRSADSKRKKAHSKQKRKAASIKLFKPIRWLLVRKGGLVQLLRERGIDPTMIVQAPTKLNALMLLKATPDQYDAAIHNVANTKYGVKLIRSDVYIPAYNEKGYVMYSVSKGGKRRNATTTNLGHQGRV